VSCHKLDANRKPIKNGARANPITKSVAGVAHYLYEIRYGPQSRKKRLWFPDDQAAEDTERKLKHEPPAKGISWQAGFNIYFEEMLDALSPRYLAEMRQRVGRAQAHFGNRPIDTITLRDFVTFVSEASKGGRARQNYHADLKRLAMWLSMRGFIPRDVAFADAPRPDHKASTRQAATVEQAKAILNALPIYARPPWLALLYSGARLTEMLNLKESDIEAGYLTLTVKGNKRKRYRITAPLQAAIDDALSRKVECDTEYVFLTSQLSRWSRHTFGRCLRESADAAGVERITSHQLRHLTASIAAGIGLSADTIQAILAHDDPNTAKVYTHTAQNQGLADVGREAVGKVIERELGTVRPAAFTYVASA